MNEEKAYAEEIDAVVDEVQAAILIDAEATTAVMKQALPMSHRYDMDQQVVADDITRAFTYRFGMEPSDYADSVRAPEI